MSDLEEARPWILSVQRQGQGANVRYVSTSPSNRFVLFRLTVSLIHPINCRVSPKADFSGDINPPLETIERQMVCQVLQSPGEV